MADRFSSFEAQLGEILHRLNDLDARMRGVEAGLAAGAQSADAPAAIPFVNRLPAGRVTPAVIAALTGRTSLVLGGGYLLRALTEADILPRPLGILLGLAYAFVWLALADRTAATERRVSAAFHAVAAAAIAFPLLYESHVKFELLGPWSLAIALTLTAALGLAVAWRRWLEAAVWVFLTASIATAAVLVWSHAAKAPFALHLVLLATMTYAVAMTRTWWRTLWAPAAVANAAVVWIALQAVWTHDQAAAFLAMATGSMLLAATIGGFAIRMLATRQDATAFEVVQSASALLVTCGTIGFVSRTFNVDAFLYGSALVIAGGLSYSLAFGVGSGTRRNFHYAASLALALVVAGGILTFRPTSSAALWVALAIAGTWLGRWASSTTLSAHGAAYLVAAAIASGLVAYAGRGLAGGVIAPSTDMGTIVWVTLAAAAICSAIAPVGIRTFGANVGSIAGRRWSVGVPRAVSLALLVLCCSGVLVLWMISSATAESGSQLAWALATIRTTVLAIAVMVTANLARRGRVREAGWLVYPLLILLGFKILVEDFQRSQPAMLFVALIVYGSVLIFAPRVASKGI